MASKKQIGNWTTAFVVLAALCATGTAQAGIFKWIKKEVVPTITGERPIVIKDYVKVSSGATQIKIGQDTAMIKMGGITVQTGKLKLRLAQGACVWTTGDVMTCAPDFIERQIKVLAEAGYQGVPPPPVKPGEGKPSITTEAAGSTTAGKPNKGGGLNFSDLDGGPIVNWEPQEFSEGFDFKNPGTATPAGKLPPSLFFHDLYTRRVKDTNNKLWLQILGRADLARMKDKEAGIACYFATDKASYLVDTQNRFNDPNGYVTVGSTATPSTDRESVLIQLIIPWSELEVPNTVQPGSDMFTQCFLTLEGEQMTHTDWMPF